MNFLEVMSLECATILHRGLGEGNGANRKSEDTDKIIHILYENIMIIIMYTYAKNTALILPSVTV